MAGQIKKKVDRLPARAVTPMKQGYYLDMDTYPELDPEGVTTLQELIGFFRWAFEIG